MGKQYRVSEQENGEPGRMDGETVDQDWVTRYIDIDARRFFIDLGYTEEMRKTKSGIITCRSIRPDKTVREMRFIPIREVSP